MEPVNLQESLRTRLGPVELRNPILVSAGTFGYGTEFESFFDPSILGGVMTKTLTLKPRAGNPPPRVIETPSGMLNAIGLQNIGVDEFLATKWPALQALRVPTIVSVAGFSVDEYAAAAKALDGKGMAAIELNLSCPNVSHGTGARCFSQNREETIAVIQAVKKQTSLPILAKLSAEVADLPSIAEAAMNAGADALTLINTIAGMVIDVETEKPVLANRTGGLSGPAIRPIAVRCIAEVYSKTKAPILGIGGVLSGRDAMELMLAGASAVAVGTANFWNPKASVLVLKELEKALAKKRKSAREIIGKAIA